MVNQTIIHLRLSRNADCGANLAKAIPVPKAGFQKKRWHWKKSERLDNDPSGARYGCFLPDLTGLARRSPAPTSHPSNTLPIPAFQPLMVTRVWAAQFIMKTTI